MNSELEELSKGLKKALNAFSRWAFGCCSFHSHEDRIVKSFFRELWKGNSLPRKMPVQKSK